MGSHSSGSYLLKISFASSGWADDSQSWEPCCRGNSQRRRQRVRVKLRTWVADVQRELSLPQGAMRLEDPMRRPVPNDTKGLADGSEALLPVAPPTPAAAPFSDAPEKGGAGSLSPPFPRHVEALLGRRGSKFRKLSFSRARPRFLSQRVRGACPCRLPQSMTSSRRPPCVARLLVDADRRRRCRRRG